MKFWTRGKRFALGRQTRPALSMDRGNSDRPGSTNPAFRNATRMHLQRLALKISIYWTIYEGVQSYPVIPSLEGPSTIA
jgi:hypothetical protein